MLTQYRQGQTFYGYDAQTGELVAFANPEQLRQYFPQGIQNNAPQLPSNVDPQKANAQPGVKTSPFNNQPGQVAGQTTTATASGFDPNSLGPEFAKLFNQLDPASQALVEGVNSMAKASYNSGLSNFSINADSLNKALGAAQNDPEIKAKYGDAAIVAQQDLQNNLGLINAEYSQKMGLTNAQQEQDRKNLAGQFAQAGQAQSGFRQQAQELQKQQQQSVIQSSARQMQQNVRQLGSQYEQQYGSAALSGIPSIVGNNAAGSVGGQFPYKPYNGLTGSIPMQQQRDIQNKQSQIYNAEKNPLT